MLVLGLFQTEKKINIAVYSYNVMMQYVHNLTNNQSHSKSYHIG